MSDFIKYRLTITHSTGATPVTRTYDYKSDLRVDLNKEAVRLREHGYELFDNGDIWSGGRVVLNLDGRTVTFTAEEIDTTPKVGDDPHF